MNTGNIKSIIQGKWYSSEVNCCVYSEHWTHQEEKLNFAAIQIVFKGTKDTVRPPVYLRISLAHPRDCHCARVQW